MLQKRQQLLHYPGGDPGFTVAEIGHRGAHNCPSWGDLQQRSHPAGMAEQRIARQLVQLCFRQRNIAQRPQPGIDPIGYLAGFNDMLDDRPSLRDTRPGAVAEAQGRLAPGDASHLLPAYRRIAPLDHFHTTCPGC